MQSLNPSIGNLGDIGRAFFREGCTHKKIRGYSTHDQYLPNIRLTKQQFDFIQQILSVCVHRPDKVRFLNLGDLLKDKFLKIKVSQFRYSNHKVDIKFSPNQLGVLKSLDQKVNDFLIKHVYGLESFVHYQNCLNEFNGSHRSFCKDLNSYYYSKSISEESLQLINAHQNLMKDIKQNLFDKLPRFQQIYFKQFGFDSFKSVIHTYQKPDINEDVFHPYNDRSYSRVKLFGPAYKGDICSVLFIPRPSFWNLGSEITKVPLHSHQSTGHAISWTLGISEYESIGHSVLAGQFQLGPLRHLEGHPLKGSEVRVSIAKLSKYHMVYWKEDPSSHTLKPFDHIPYINLTTKQNIN